MEGGAICLGDRATLGRHKPRTRARTIMIKQDKHIVINHLAGAILVIAALVAAPFGWSALTSAQHEPVASATSVTDLN
jgi:hypothetical protein